VFNVLITARSFGFASGKAMDAFKNNHAIKVVKPDHIVAFNEQEMYNLVPGQDAVIVGTDKITKNVIARADRLKVISKHGVGVDNVDIAAATKAGIIVTNLLGMNDRTVADMAFGMILALSRQICYADRQVKNQHWDKILAHDVWGKTLGVIGTGQIGQNLIRRAQAFDMKVIAYDLFQDDEAAKRIDFTYVSLDQLLTEADIISIHVPWTPETEGLIGTEAFEKMKEGAYLVNTARGGVVDEVALVEALKTKKIAGAALDVFESTFPQMKDIYSLDNLILTPHIAAYTYETLEAMDMVLVEEYRRIAQGKMPEIINIINREVTKYRK
jgi:D-3-phosphoglycerate dehydrogenase